MRVAMLATIVWLLSVATTCAWAKEGETTKAATAFTENIRPLLAKYCQECHSAERMEADIDLAAFRALDDVRKQARTWQKVGEMLDSGQMPPPEAKPLKEDERKVLRDWVRKFLTTEAAARAGDPGRVVLRRLSNAEYTYTVRDLLGRPDLQPAKEFPVDGAAGEGFTNTGSALVMSPALVTKYFDAAKDLADHAVLLPSGFRFSPYTTRSDWTNETLADIRGFYAKYTDASAGDQVNLQGIVFNTNGGGRLPVERYLAATIVEREALQSGRKSLADVARERNLNEKYLTTLWQQMRSEKPALLMSGLRERWRKATRTDDAGPLTAEIAAWQRGLWRFGSVGHIGKVGGPKRWLEPVSPLVNQQELRFKLSPPKEGEDIVVSLVSGDAGDDNAHDYVIWRTPRLVMPGRPDVLLKDVRALTQELSARRKELLANTTRYLQAADAASKAEGKFEIAELAKQHEVDAAGLRAWLDFLAIGGGEGTKIEGHFTSKLENSAGYNFVQGWGSHQTPLLLANSSDQHVRIPGNMRPHGVVVHPSPTLRAGVGWQSPVTGALKIEGVVTHAHPECGNGVSWSLELRRGALRRQLASGTAQGAKESKLGPLEGVAVQKGDVLSLLIGPRDGNHSCDLTNLDWRLTLPGDKPLVWDLAANISGNVLAGNPHDDRLGNKSVWHFYAEEEKKAGPTFVIPAGSLLAMWQTAIHPDDRKKLALGLQQLLDQPAPDVKSPDAVLHQQLTSLSGPLLSGLIANWSREQKLESSQEATPASGESKYGVDPQLFGKHPAGESIDATSLCVQAPQALEVRLPAPLFAGAELVVTAALDPTAGREGSVQINIVAGTANKSPGLQAAEAKTIVAPGAWTGDNRQTSFSAPLLVSDGSAAKKRIEADLAEFRELFPAALCYTKIVPVDEVVTLTLFYREDDHLVRLMLNDTERMRLDALWAELHYVSQDAFTLVDALEQLIQYATQDANPKVFEPLREPFAQRAAAYRQQLVDSEPSHLSALLAFAAKAYRRPLTAAEQIELKQLYAKLRQQELPHDQAFRLTLARVLISPAFLYKIEKPVAGNKQGPVTDLELASRLSYFLWSSAPDEELLQTALAGRLHEPEVLLAQSQRMLKSDKTRRLATEFACQWLHIYDFDQLDEKSERHFPSFVNLRGAMYEESIRFFTDLFQNNGRVIDILDADHTFVNGDLAAHYGLANVTGKGWQRVDGVRKFDRGGILGQATTLAKQSGASRTSPILRGNWISEVLLGERLPRPPKDVPQLPDDETATAGLSVRELVAKHSSDAKCAVCHKKIDPLGFSLEAFDAIGRRREKDFGDRPIDTKTKTIEGVELNGLSGLRNYLLTTRKDAFVRQFCRKLLGYALGRSVQLSDEPLLAEMQAQLKTSDDRLHSLIETIVLSRQFREIRGKDAAYDDE
jgi:hypothetical protein